MQLHSEDTFSVACKNTYIHIRLFKIVLKIKITIKNALKGSLRGWPEVKSSPRKGKKSLKNNSTRPQKLNKQKNKTKIRKKLEWKTF